MEYKTDVPGMYKTTEGSIINKDNQALNLYKANREKAKKLQELETTVASLKEDMQEIKSLLKGLTK
jgi:hypothetical protein